MILELWYFGLKYRCCVERVVWWSVIARRFRPNAALTFHFHFHRVRAIFSTCLTRRPSSCRLFRYTHLPPTPFYRDSHRRRCTTTIHLPAYFTLTTHPAPYYSQHAIASCYRADFGDAPRPGCEVMESPRSRCDAVTHDTAALRHLHTGLN